MQTNKTISNETSTHPAMDNLPQDVIIAVTAPGQLKVIRRNGSLTPFDDNKIAVAVTKAFLALEGNTAAASTRIHDLVQQLTTQVCDAFNRRLPTGGTIHIEDIQDQVELALMRASEYQVARSYVLYREERRKIRDANSQSSDTDILAELTVTLRDGRQVPIDKLGFQEIIAEACEGIANTHGNDIWQETKRNLFNGAPLSDVNTSLIMSARTLIEKEPDNTYVAARLLLNALRAEALNFLNLAQQANQQQMTELYSDYFKRYISKGVELELLAPELKSFDLDTLANALKPQRDTQFTYLGLQTLYDRYFLHSNDTRFEMPQAFFMRVAMGLATREQDKEQKAIEFYHLLSSFDFMSSTPTLFNSGTLRPQCSSCYLSTIPDDLDGIYSAMRDNALLSKYAGGLGNDWTPVRALGSYIKGTNGKSLGVIPFLNVANASTVAVNQGGKRKGAVVAYLETWHLDIEDFLELRKNTGDERRRTHDMNIANWIPDLFMKRVFNQQDWTLFSPNDVPDLHDLYGLEFEQAYQAYEQQASQGIITNSKKIPAVTLWRKMLSMLFETGHPWVTFKDACNIRSPQQHVGVIHSSNLCTEITLNTSKDEIAVCNLGSVNLLAHIDDNGLNLEKLESTINTAVRMLDNVIEYNYYSVPQARNSNLKHRPIGLGIMGFQDALYKLKIAYNSQQAVEFADKSMEAVSYFAIQASTNLAEEHGPYQTFQGSLWSQGILPIDSIQHLKQARGEYLEQDTSSTMDWEALRTRVQNTGMRNSNVMAIAPTATIANICGVTASIEPTYQNLFVKSNLSGEFTVVNPALVADLKALNLWDDVMVNDLKYYNGSVQNIHRIPDELKQLYATAFEVEPRWLVEAAARRQKWLDQAQSLNIYVSEPSGKKLDMIYRMAWLRGLKTTYYLRTLAATETEKSTITTNALNAVQTNTEPKVCSILDPDCDACQ